MVSLGTQPANRKSGFGHSSPTGARAQDLSRQPARPDLWGARVSNDPGLPDRHGQLNNEGLPLPRIPPLRGRVGLRYQVNAFQVGGEVRATTTQNRVSGVEEPTEGYHLLKLFASYSFVTGQTTSTGLLGGCQEST